MDLTGRAHRSASPERPPETAAGEVEPELAAGHGRERGVSRSNQGWAARRSGVVASPETCRSDDGDEYSGGAGDSSDGVDDSAHVEGLRWVRSTARDTGSKMARVRSSTAAGSGSKLDGGAREANKGRLGGGRGAHGDGGLGDGRRRISG